MKRMSLKQKIFHEVVEYWINVVYLALVFAAFTQYRRLLLADVGILYANYWGSGHCYQIRHYIRDTDSEEDTAMKRKTITMLLAIVILPI